MRQSYFWRFLFLNATLAGCAIGPQYKPPEPDVPSFWSQPSSEGMHEGSTACFLWWESLNDPTLNALMRRAAFQNLDLHVAGARILEARLEKKGKTADLYPHLDGSLTSGCLSYNKEGILNRVLGEHGRSNSRKELGFFEIGFDADWEIDLFGAKAHEINSAQARVEASEDSFYATWVTLSAEIGRTYIELRSLQQRLSINERNSQSQKDSVYLTQNLLSIGMASVIDFNQAQEQLTQLAAQRPLLQLSINKAIHRLSILLGYAPSELYADLSEPKELPLLPIDKPIGVPSELLRRRPDIRRAERNLAAATEDIGTAMASRFPRLSLRGFVGEISSAINALFNPASGVWFASPQFAIPLINSRLIEQDVDYNQIKARRAYYEYRKSVLEALEEAENAIASFHYELERNGSLADAQLFDQEAYQLTLQLYQRGVKSYLDVLMADRSLLAAEEAYSQSQMQLLFHYISLYKALGGGWDVKNCMQE